MPRRRRPRIGPFLGTGGFIGFLAGFAVAIWGGESTKYGLLPQIGYLGVFGAGLGLLLSGVVFVLVDRRSD